MDLEFGMDDFILLACDGKPSHMVVVLACLPVLRLIIRPCDFHIGVWDVMSSQEAVDFMQKQLCDGVSPSAAVEALFDECICDDPHSAAGQGADNMTCEYDI